MKYRNITYSFFAFFLMLFSAHSFGQYAAHVDSTLIPFSKRMQAKPMLHYTVGSSFTFIPRYGSLTGISLSPSLWYPVSPKISVEAGLLAGRYFQSLKNSMPENGSGNAFNSLAVYGTANYQLNRRLSIYGTGIRQVGGNMPLYNLPASSYSIGSTLNFGNFSIGAEIRMSDWNNSFTPYSYPASRNLYPYYPW